MGNDQKSKKKETNEKELDFVGSISGNSVDVVSNKEEFVEGTLFENTDINIKSKEKKATVEKTSIEEKTIQKKIDKVLEIKFENKKENNKMLALGLIETRGLTAAIEAADTMLKAADVKVLGTEKIGSGLVSVVIQGEVGAVKAAVEAGSEAAQRLGEVIAVHVIPRPSEEVKKVLPIIG